MVVILLHGVDRLTLARVVVVWRIEVEHRLRVVPIANNVQRVSVVDLAAHKPPAPGVEHRHAHDPSVGCFRHSAS